MDGHSLSCGNIIACNALPIELINFLSEWKWINAALIPMRMSTQAFSEVQLIHLKQTWICFSQQPCIGNYGK